MDKDNSMEENKNNQEITVDDFEVVSEDNVKMLKNILSGRYGL